MTTNNNQKRVSLSSFDPLASRPSQQQQQNVPVPPSAPRSTAPQQQYAAQPRLNANQSRYLEQQGFSSGMIAAFAKHAGLTPLRIWILDNSISMSVRDAHRIVGDFSNIQNLTNATRWEELQDCVAYHAQAASLLPLPVRFALVNPPSFGPAVFGVGEGGPAGIANEISVLKTVMTQVQPSGPTQLSQHLRNIHRYISSIAPQLVRQHQTATVVLATQGLPTDASGASGPAVVQEFLQCLQSLENLPVWVVVRLCTDDEQVFDFYNSLDVRLSLKYDVLDDFFGESLELYLRNPWLNYALPLHRLRETGFSIPVLDILDERALNPGEVRDLCGLLFSNVVLPDPYVDWMGFLRAVTHAMSREKQPWNPISKTVTPWINTAMLHAIHMNNTNKAQQPSSSQQGAPFVGQPGMPQQQQPFSTSATPQPRPPLQQTPHVVATPNEDALTVVKKGILTSWAMEPPQYQNLKSLPELLGSVHTTFPPAFGVERHEYFDKHKPFSLDALSSQNQAVLKRAVRKLKFFLHPDKLPRDFSEKQSFLCKMLWDITADAWDAFENK